MECKLENMTVHYNVYGEGKPVLMLHGYRTNNRILIGCMEPIFEKRSGYKRIYPDLPGMGKTKVGWVRNSDDMLDVILRFIDELIPNQRFLVVGYSYGGYLARGVIVKKFAVVDGALLIAPLIIPEKPKRNLPKHNSLETDSELISRLVPPDAEEFQSMAIIQNKRVWARFRDDFLSGTKVANDEFLSQLWEEGYPFSFNVDKLYEKFDNPTLIVLGRQDAFVGYRNAWKIIEKFPRATYAILDKAGHLLQIEQETVFNSLVNEWLDRVENII